MPPRVVVYAIALGAAALSLLLLDGRIHHDEVHQYAEPAHRMVWGFGSVTHEWHRGMRNTLAPGALAGLFALARALRCDGPLALLALRCSVATALSLLALRAVMDHVSAHARDPRLARYAGAALALSLPWAALASRFMGESLSIFAALFALRALDRARLTLAGALAGLAFALRYPAGLIALGLALPLLPSPRAFARYCAGAGLVVVVLALLDARTWGTPLGSVIAYARFNLVEGRARIDYGARPWWFYLACALAFAPWPMALGLSGLRHAHRARWSLAPLGSYLGAMSLIAHKEPRFFLTVIPLFVAALGCAARGVSRRAPVALGLVLAQGLAVTALWWQRGSFQGDIARGTRAAATRPDLAALWVMNAAHPGWSSLRRDVPLRADPRERLEVNLAALDRAPRPGRGRSYALCDGRLRPGERARCTNALQRRGFVRVSAHGRAWLMAR